ncbi:MAG TPA: hypothetical protein VM166_06330 [Gemmatimonadaceae bacterium]|nr:hypothetical protein [Gemmatimonadaceae bacterium]
MSVTAPAPCVLAIDVEPAQRLPVRGDTAPWNGFRQTVDFLVALRAEVGERSGDTPRFLWTMRMDPQVEVVHGTSTWVVDRHPELIERIVVAGDEVGLHVHAWRWDDASDGWVADYGDEEWVEHCLGFSFDAFRRAFGRGPKSFRSGDRFFSDRVVRHLERQGIKQDLTLEPGEPAQAGLFANEAHTGELPDMRDVPRSPFQDGGLWFIPLTAGRWRPEVATLDQTTRHVTSAVLKPFVDVPPYLWPARAGLGTLRLWESPRIFRDALRDAIANTPRPLLAFAIRTDMVLNPLIRRRMWRNLLAISQQGIDVQFCPPAEALSRWRDQQV